MFAGLVRHLFLFSSLLMANVILHMLPSCAFLFVQCVSVLVEGNYTWTDVPDELPG